MRNSTTLIGLFFVFCVFTSNAQQSGKSTRTEPTTTTTLVPEKAEEIQNKIASIDSHLQAIETKKAFVLSSEAETQRANDSGWFDSMEEIKEQLMTKKTKLINYLNSFDDE